jgi:hypothetical protein
MTLADVTIPIHWPHAGLSPQAITMVLIGLACAWAAMAVHNATHHGATFTEAISLGLVSLTSVLETLKKVRPGAKSQIDKAEEIEAIVQAVIDRLQKPDPPKPVVPATPTKANDAAFVPTEVNP